jgi:hypothetical protein
MLLLIMLTFTVLSLKRQMWIASVLKASAADTYSFKLQQFGSLKRSV